MHKSARGGRRDRGTRAGARAQGATVDDKLLFNDPEAHMRRMREEQRASQGRPVRAGQRAQHGARISRLPPTHTERGHSASAAWVTEEHVHHGRGALSNITHNAT
jgi:hydroxyacyl-ACP dehydratase HTD2-like protein with hotdog domain